MTTITGLSVTADLDEATYKKGQKVAKEDLKKVNPQPHDVCPDWNYTITPSQTGEAPSTIKGP
jgi:hypothetical protein